MLVYLAGPIDEVQWLNQAGISTFSPAHAFSVAYLSSSVPYFLRKSIFRRYLGNLGANI